MSPPDIFISLISLLLPRSHPIDKLGKNLAEIRLKFPEVSLATKRRYPASVPINKISSDASKIALKAPNFSDWAKIMGSTETFLSINEDETGFGDLSSTRSHEPGSFGASFIDL